MMESPTTWALRDVYGITPIDVYAVAGENSYHNMGAIIHYDGNSWKTVLEGTGRLLSVWGSSATDVYAVGPGIMHHFDGIEWSTTYPPVSKGIWGSDSANVYILGSQALLHYDGTTWSQMDPEHYSIACEDIWGIGEDVYIVFSYGSMLHYDGSNWEFSKITTGPALYAIWGTGPEDIFTAGESGAIFHYGKQE